MIRQLAPGAGNFMPTRFFFSLQRALAEGYPDTSQLAKVDRGKTFDFVKDAFSVLFPEAVEHFSREGATTPGMTFYP